MPLRLLEKCKLYRVNVYIPAKHDSNGVSVLYPPAITFASSSDQISTKHMSWGILFHVGGGAQPLGSKMLHSFISANFSWWHLHTRWSHLTYSIVIFSILWHLYSNLNSIFEIGLGLNSVDISNQPKNIWNICYIYWPISHHWDLSDRKSRLAIAMVKICCQMKEYEKWRFWICELFHTREN